jgi:hypothetical protein
LFAFFAYSEQGPAFRAARSRFTAKIICARPAAQLEESLSMSHNTVHTGTLVYDAAAELLSGKIGHHTFHMRAFSGGSRGHAHVNASTAKKYLHHQAGNLSSHFANTPEISKGGHYKQRGGTLPAGHYTCEYMANHKTFHECIRLHRGADATAIHSPFSPFPIPHHRGDDFFIHGHGPKGSDGCIVPEYDGERRRLNQAVHHFAGKVILEVKNVSYLLPAELEGQIG